MRHDFSAPVLESFLESQQDERESPSVTLESKLFSGAIPLNYMMSSSEDGDMFTAISDSLGVMGRKIRAADLKALPGISGEAEEWLRDAKVICKEFGVKIHRMGIVVLNGDQPEVAHVLVEADKIHPVLNESEIKTLFEDEKTLTIAKAGEKNWFSVYQKTQKLLVNKIPSEFQCGKSYSELSLFKALARVLNQQFSTNVHTAQSIRNACNNPKEDDLSMFLGEIICKNYGVKLHIIDIKEEQISHQLMEMERIYTTAGDKKDDVLSYYARSMGLQIKLKSPTPAAKKDLENSDSMSEESNQKYESVRIKDESVNMESWVEPLKRQADGFIESQFCFRALGSSSPESIYQDENTLHIVVNGKEFLPILSRNPRSRCAPHFMPDAHQENTIFLPFGAEATRSKVHQELKNNLAQEAVQTLLEKSIQHTLNGNSLEDFVSYLMIPSPSQVERIYLDDFLDQDGDHVITREHFVDFQKQNPAGIFLLPGTYADTKISAKKMHDMIEFQVEQGKNPHDLLGQIIPIMKPGTSKSPIYDLSVMVIPTTFIFKEIELQKKSIRKAVSKLYTQVKLGRKILIPFYFDKGESCFLPAFSVENFKISREVKEFIYQQIHDFEKFCHGEILLGDLDEVYQQAFESQEPWPVAGESFDPEVQSESLQPCLDIARGLQTIRDDSGMGKEQKIAEIGAFLRSCLSQRHVMSAYLDYDLRDSKIALGYCHPGVLQAYAQVKDFALFCSELDETNKKLPLPEYCFSGEIANKKRVDLVFQSTVQIKVPGDNSCLFWAIAVSYLLQGLSDDAIFAERFLLVFGRESLAHLAHVKKLCQEFRPRSNEALFSDVIFNRLIREEFRRRVVDYISDNVDEFRRFHEGDFDVYLAGMRSPDGWGGDLEVGAASSLLQCLIHVQARGYTNDFPGGENGRVDIIHNINHYNFSFSKQTYRSIFGELSIEWAQEEIAVSSTKSSRGLSFFGAAPGKAENRDRRTSSASDQDLDDSPYLSLSTGREEFVCDEAMRKKLCQLARDACGTQNPELLGAILFPEMHQRNFETFMQQLQSCSHENTQLRLILKNTLKYETKVLKGLEILKQTRGTDNPKRDVQKLLDDAYQECRVLLRHELQTIFSEGKNLPEKEKALPMVPPSQVRALQALDELGRKSYSQQALAVFDEGLQNVKHAPELPDTLINANDASVLVEQLNQRITFLQARISVHQDEKEEGERQSEALELEYNEYKNEWEKSNKLWETNLRLAKRKFEDEEYSKIIFPISVHKATLSKIKFSPNFKDAKRNTLLHMATHSYIHGGHLRFTYDYDFPKGTADLPKLKRGTYLLNQDQYGNYSLYYYEGDDYLEPKLAIREINIDAIQDFKSFLNSVPRYFKKGKEEINKNNATHGQYFLEAEQRLKGFHARRLWTMIELLVNYGMDPFATNGLGESPWSMASTQDSKPASNCRRLFLDKVQNWIRLAGISAECGATFAHELSEWITFPAKHLAWYSSENDKRREWPNRIYWILRWNDVLGERGLEIGLYQEMFIKAVLSQKFDDFKAGVDLITSNTIRLEGKLHEGMKQAAAQELSLIQAPSFTKDRLRAVRNQQKGGSKQEQEARDFGAAVGKQNVEKGGEIEVRGSSLATKSVEVPSSIEKGSASSMLPADPSSSAKQEAGGQELLRENTRLSSQIEVLEARLREKRDSEEVLEARLEARLEAKLMQLLQQRNNPSNEASTGDDGSHLQRGPGM